MATAGGFGGEKGFSSWVPGWIRIDLICAPGKGLMGREEALFSGRAAGVVDERCLAEGV
jgi:hypothetical protein